MSESSAVWPTQDGVDRSHSFAIIASLRPLVDSMPYGPGWSEWDAYNGQTQDQLERAINEAIRDLDLLPSGWEVQARRYQIGPAAQGLFYDWIVTIWENRENIAYAKVGIDAVLATYKISTMARKKLRTWSETLDNPPSEVQLAFPPAAIANLCSFHARTTYDRLGTPIQTSWYPLTEEFYGGYQSPAHPTANMEYLVTVSCPEIEFTYRVDGTAQVSAHHVKDGPLTTALPIPLLLPDEDAEDDTH